METASETPIEEDAFIKPPQLQNFCFALLRIPKQNAICMQNNNEKRIARRPKHSTYLIYTLPN